MSNEQPTFESGVAHLWARLLQTLKGYVKKSEVSTVQVEQTDDGAIVTITSADGGRQVKIQNGEKGATGETGATGEKGEKGDKGDKGDKGEKGDKGATGATGPRGPQGPTGATGPAGVTFTLSGTTLTIKKG